MKVLIFGTIKKAQQPHGSSIIFNHLSGFSLVSLKYPLKALGQGVDSEHIAYQHSHSKTAQLTILDTYK